MQRFSSLSRSLLAAALLAGAIAGLTWLSPLSAQAVGPEVSGTPSWLLASATSVPTTAYPSPASVVISEIAWSGTSASAEDEWIELLNRSDYPVDLSGWTLRARDGEPVIHLKGIIPAHGFFLLERGDDQTISDIRASQIYQGALSDAGERLLLYDRSWKLVDHANAFSDTWLAGALSRRRSMERSSFLADKSVSWSTHNGLVMNGLDANGRPIHGTPRRRNSAFFVTLTATDTPFAGWLPDLIVSGMSIQLEHPACLLPGDHLGLRVWVANIGRARSGKFAVDIHPQEGKEQGAVAGLGAGERISLFFDGSFEYYYRNTTAIVDSTGRIVESNEDNNMLTQQLPVPTPPHSCTPTTPFRTPTPSLTPLPGGSQPAK